MDSEDVILLSVVNSKVFKDFGKGNKIGIKVMTWHQNHVQINLWP